MRVLLAGIAGAAAGFLIPGVGHTIASVAGSATAVLQALAVHAVHAAPWSSPAVVAPLCGAAAAVLAGPFLVAGVAESARGDRVARLAAVGLLLTLVMLAVSFTAHPGWFVVLALASCVLLAIGGRHWSKMALAAPVGALTAWWVRAGIHGTWPTGPAQAVVDATHLGSVRAWTLTLGAAAAMMLLAGMARLCRPPLDRP